MVKFNIERNTSLGRIGKLDKWGHAEVSHSTPSFMTYLRSGHIPHLTWDVASNYFHPCQKPIYQLTSPSLLNNLNIVKKTGRGVSFFCGIPAGSAVHLTVLDPLGKMPGGFNDKHSVAVWTKTGKVSLTVDKWKEVIETFDCSSFDTMADYDSPKEAGLKKQLKAVERTKGFCDKFFDLEVQGFPITTIIGGFNKGYRRKCCVEIGSQKMSYGYNIELNEYVDGCDVQLNELQEVLEEMFSTLNPTKIRCVAGPFNPRMVLWLAKSGIDMFDSSFAIKLADEGKGFCLADDYESSGGYSTIYFGDEKLSTQFSTPFEHCQCYTCVNYTKGYLQHLYNTKELLASILLVIHNLTAYDTMFSRIRRMLHEVS